MFTTICEAVFCAGLVDEIVVGAQIIGFASRALFKVGWVIERIVEFFVVNCGLCYGGENFFAIDGGYVVCRIGFVVC